MRVLMWAFIVIVVLVVLVIGTWLLFLDLAFS